jgi:hypothetical protein
LVKKKKDWLDGYGPSARMYLTPTSFARQNPDPMGPMYMDAVSQEPGRDAADLLSTSTYTRAP